MKGQKFTIAKRERAQEYTIPIQNTIHIQHTTTNIPYTSIRSWPDWQRPRPPEVLAAKHRGAKGEQQSKGDTQEGKGSRVATRVAPQAADQAKQQKQGGTRYHPINQSGGLLPYRGGALSPIYISAIFFRKSNCPMCHATYVHLFRFINRCSRQICMLDTSKCLSPARAASTKRLLSQKTATYAYAYIGWNEFLNYAHSKVGESTIRIFIRHT